jgi:hypothetical protein
MKLNKLSYISINPSPLQALPHPHLSRTRLTPSTDDKCPLTAANVFPFNPSNAELNPICHLLVLLGDLTFMGPCIVSIFQYISNKMQRYTVYLYLETALHV